MEICHPCQRYAVTWLFKLTHKKSREWIISPSFLFLGNRRKKGSQTGDEKKQPKVEDGAQGTQQFEDNQMREITEKCANNSAIGTKPKFWMLICSDFLNEGIIYNLKCKLKSSKKIFCLIQQDSKFAKVQVWS